MTDATRSLIEAVREAAGESTALQIAGGESKAFYGRESGGKPLSTADHRGVANYEPAELVVTVRAGTPLSELEQVLRREGQMLPFEPPHFGPAATIGGAVACGLSGPRRPYAGAARDFVLGVRIINGRGEHLRFGGQVMKNVAGYDVSRLMTGALGTLGLITEVSLKVQPLPEQELTLRQNRSAAEAIQEVNQWAGQPLPLTGMLYRDGELSLRLSGSEQALKAARRHLPGDAIEGDWGELKEHELVFFQDPMPIWRIDCKPGTPPMEVAGEWLIEWGGAQRWLKTEQSAESLRERLRAYSAFATLFRHGDRRGEVFHPLPPALLSYHRKVKQAFDPKGIFNPGRMYRDL